MKKISIIIPAYNVENYIEKCINSVLQQTYNNIEIIIVDDGSTDSTGKICDKYKSEYVNIQVIHQKNAGLPAARNTGLNFATGDYIGFIDSDDYIYEDMYEVLVDNITKMNADIAMVQFCYEVNGEKVYKPSTDEVEVFNTSEAIIELIKDKKIHNFAWNKLYNAELWKKHKFKEGRVYEDFEVMYKVFLDCKKIVYIDSIKYVYVQRENSIMHKPISQYSLDRLNAVMERYNYIKTTQNKDLQFYNSYALAVNMIVIYRSISLYDYDDIYDEFMKYFELFMDIIQKYEFRIRKLLTPNQNKVLDYMKEDMTTAKIKIKNTKNIDK